MCKRIHVNACKCVHVCMNVCVCMKHDLSVVAALMSRVLSDFPDF